MSSISESQSVPAPVLPNSPPPSRTASTSYAIPSSPPSQSRSRPKSLLARLKRHSNSYSQSSDADSHSQYQQEPNSQPFISAMPFPIGPSRQTDCRTQSHSSSQPYGGLFHDPGAGLNLNLDWISSKGQGSREKRMSRVPFPGPTEVPFGVDGGTSESEEDEMDWERVRTLPRVRLIPPEDEGDPITLYPLISPARGPLLSFDDSDPLAVDLFVFRPPSSPPLTPWSASPRPNPDTDPNFNARRSSVSSISSAITTTAAANGGAPSATWGSMATGFVLPPPAFSRRSGVRSGVVMPKKRSEVERDRTKKSARGMMESREERDAVFLAQEKEREMEEMEKEEMLSIGSSPLSISTDGFGNKEEVTVSAACISPSSPAGGQFPTVAEITSAMDLKDPQVEEAFNWTDPNPEGPEEPDESTTGGRTAVAASTNPVEAVVEESDSTTDSGVDFLVSHAPESTSSPTLAIAPTVVPEPTPVPIPTAAPVIPVTTDTPDCTAPPKSDTVVRKTRAQSLTSALIAKPASTEPLPPVPAIRPELRKQKSLKRFFFSSTTDLPDAVRAAEAAAPVPPVPQLKQKKSRIGLLARPKSKPSLRLETKAKSTGVTNSTSGSDSSSSSSGSSSGDASLITPNNSEPNSASSSQSQSQSQSENDGPVPPPGKLSKRFSLSNMSAAFKKKSASSQAVNAASAPRVPELPAIYRKGKDKSKAKESAASIGPGTAQAQPEAEAEAGPSSQPMTRGNTAPILSASAPVSMSVSRRPVAKRGESMTALSSIESGTILDTTHSDSYCHSPVEMTSEPPSLLPSPILHSSSSVAQIPSHSQSDNLDSASIHSPPVTPSAELDETHAQLMHISPRTRRNPSQSDSLQGFVGSVAPQEVVVNSGADKAAMRRSVQATVVLGPLVGSESSTTQITAESVCVASTSTESQEDATGTGTEVDAATSSKTDTANRPRLIRRQGGSTDSSDSLSRSSESDSSADNHLLTPTSEVPSRSICLEGTGEMARRMDMDMDRIRATVPISTPMTITFAEMPLEAEDDSNPDNRLEPQAETTNKASTTGLSVDPMVSFPSIESDLVYVDMDLDIDLELDLDLALDLVQDHDKGVHDEDKISSLPRTANSSHPPSSACSSKQSTPKGRFSSPDALMRLITSPRRKSSLYQSGPTSTPPTYIGGAGQKNTKSDNVKALPPVPTSTGLGYSSLAAGVKLQSLHFDSLGLDFGGGGELDAGLMSWAGSAVSVGAGGMWRRSFEEVV